MHNYLNRKKLSVHGLPGFKGPSGADTLTQRGQEIPFEKVIIEESGFLPAGNGNMITVKVDGHVAVSFPADTDVSVIAKFVRKMGKESGDVYVFFSKDRKSMKALKWDDFYMLMRGLTPVKVMVGNRFRMAAK